MVLLILYLVQIITIVILYYRQYTKTVQANARILELESIIRALQAHINSEESKDRKSTNRRVRK